jgi:peptidyl-prolyl cis-trans isomerase B (cyclophilin B)
VPGSKRERELARRRYERRQAQRVEVRHRHRRRNTIIALVALVVGGGGGAAAAVLAGGGGTDKVTTASPTPTPPAAAAAVACGGSKPAAPKKLSWPKEPPMSIDTAKTYAMTLDTSCGQITVALDAKQAPHTVNALNFLAGKGFYDGTFCHRETSSATLTVLQCGDPTGTGEGGPGFTLPEENLKGATYGRGVVAMAKTSAPHSTGSQFFLVDKDSQLPPQYTVVGHITKGLDVLDKIMKIGLNPVNGPGDGAPKAKVYLDHVTVTAT